MYSNYKTRLASDLWLISVRSTPLVLVSLFGDLPWYNLHDEDVKNKQPFCLIVVKQTTQVVNKQKGADQVRLNNHVEWCQTQKWNAKPQQHWCHDACILACELSMLLTGWPQQDWCHDTCILACELSKLLVGHSNFDVMTPASWLVSWVC